LRPRIDRAAKDNDQRKSKNRPSQSAARKIHRQASEGMTDRK
jgi:hypothetical protein